MENKGFIPPQAVDLEAKVLGALLIDERASLEALPVLKLSEMFFKFKHQLIFEAIQDLNYENRPVDLVTVSQKLTEKGKLEEIGGYTGLIDLTQLVSSAGNIEEWSYILVQYWLKRRMIQNAAKIQQMAYSAEEDSLEVLSAAAKMNDELSELLFTGSSNKTYATALADVVKRVELLSSQEEGKFTGVPTGFERVDRFTGGWQPSDLIIVAARPGMGKTALILKNLVECGLKNIPAGMFSLEMSIQQLAARTVAINSNFHLTQLIRDGFEKLKYFKTLKEKETEMNKFPLLIDDTAAQDIRDIISKARIWKRKHNIQILFVDYIQLVTDKSKANNREQEIASISRNLKKLAKELNIPVIALSQLNRSVETRVDKRPKLSDIRESGAIEQDADIITFLFRPEYYDLENPHYLEEQGANAEFIFAKYRAGSLSTLGLHFQGDKAKYSDPVERREEWMDEDDDELPRMDPDTDEPF